MKQIPFTLEAFGPDGLLKDGYIVKDQDGCPYDFIKFYGGTLTFVYCTGGTGNCFVDNFTGQLYRRTRTAEEVAKEIWDNRFKLMPDGFGIEQLREALVQAGMDEMS
jgi:hypothetical protein